MPAAPLSDYLCIDRLVPGRDGAVSHVRAFALDPGQGDWVALLPSLGRGVEDFTGAYRSTIAVRLVGAGFRVLLVQPRGIGRSTGDLTPGAVTMDMLASDLTACFDALDIGRLHLAGHAFGNRLARVLAMSRPARVQTLTLLAAGGNFEMSRTQKQDLIACFDLDLDETARMAAVGHAFFAPGNDPDLWRDGWYPALAAAQARAALAADGARFRSGGGQPMLIIQAGDDRLASPEQAGRALKSALGDQVSYAEIPFAGHALTSEQPEIIAALMVEFLNRFDPG